MAPYIAGGLVGFSIGVFLQRLIINFSVGSVSPNICNYCHWKKANQWRWDKKTATTGDGFRRSFVRLGRGRIARNGRRIRRQAFRFCGRVMLTPKGRQSETMPKVFKNNH